ncbi:electron transport complex protein RnfC [Natranaerovirga hydrolytica]|uniref:Ion-translocating oxidoreductase complex subunit C n=1 Tax=Natranaerovirga hydrolytica TaxID=680378 RepID=A0A4R1MXT0_9FIRM|nr:electron transport complex subunit RsxC [Natranaerovirga hydrolytica]TCK98077.1 electron transport complex protein RnfC [Natranaerovirga hydrolytica]
MGALTFKRGIHPKDLKKATMNKPVKYILPKGDLVYPLVQHMGVPCKPLVKKGDHVLVGEKIGESDAVFSSPIHSTVSGTVKNIKPMLVQNGSKVNSIIVENDGEYTEHERIQPIDNPEKLTPEEIRNIIKEAGIVGMGGACFPTHIKLTPPKDKKIDYIVVNGSECEPYLTSDYRVMLEEPERIVLGLKMVLKLFPDAKAIIGIEDNKKKGIEILEEHTKDEDRIEVVTLKTKYPQGAEKQLVSAITGRKFMSKQLPLDVGCIVQNIETIVAIHRAIYRGRPIMRRIVTVSGGAIKEPKNIKVKIGTNFQELIDEAGGFVSEPAKLIAGGPMMGLSIFSLDLPVIKGTSAILCLTEKEAKVFEESNCIRCGKCVGACANGLLPLLLNQYVLKNDNEMFLKYNGMECCECGSCSYVCPSKRHIAQTIKTKRREMLANKKR